MDLHAFLSLLRRNLILIVATSLVGAASAATYSLIVEPTYAATSKSYVAATSGGTVQDLSQGTNFTQQSVESFAAVATTAYVLEDVRKDLQLPYSLAHLSKQVSVTVPSGTVVIEVRVDAASPSLAARIANAIALRLANAVSELIPSSPSTSPSVKITQIQPATVPTAPASPNYPVNILAGLLIGLAVALALALARLRLNTRLRSPHDVETASKSPTYGLIPFDSQIRKSSVAAVSDDRSSEAFRQLRTNLEFAGVSGERASYAVTSSVPGEGKSTSTVRLAVTLAAAGRRVVLIDADLRRPRIAQLFGMDGSVGLTDILIGKVEFTEASQAWSDDHLIVLPAGTTPPNPSELLQSDRMADLIERLESEFDVVLIDAPPVLPVADAAILAGIARGVLFVAALGIVRRAEVARSLEIIARVRGHVVGTVITMVPTKGSYGYGVAYGYSYGGGQDPPGSTPSDGGVNGAFPIGA